MCTQKIPCCKKSLHSNERSFISKRSWKNYSREGLFKLKDRKLHQIRLPGQCKWCRQDLQLTGLKYCFCQQNLKTHWNIEILLFASQKLTGSRTLLKKLMGSAEPVEPPLTTALRSMNFREMKWTSLHVVTTRISIGLTSQSTDPIITLHSGLAGHDQ